MNRSFWKRAAGLLVACLVLGMGNAQAAHSCNLTATSLGVLYVQGNQARTDAVGSVTMTCTRDASDDSTLTYRIGADAGDNANGATRRTRLGASNNYLTYTLTRGANPGGAASCADTSNWSAPLLGTANTMTGTLNFGPALTTSVTWGFCVRVRGDQGNPQAGSFLDNITLYAMYPAAWGPLISTGFTYTIGARSNCVIGVYPTDMQFNYNAFQTTAQVIAQSFRLQCSNNLNWNVSVSPAAGTLLGLNYALALSPASGRGNGAQQTVNITGTMPANQQGTCATAVCNAQRQHTVTISY